MARITIDETLVIDSPLMSDNWELILTGIPTGFGNRVAREALRIRCKTISMPGLTNEPQELPLHGYKLNFAGRTTFPGTLGITYNESNALEIYSSMLGWVQAARDYRTQLSGGKNQLPGGYLAMSALLNVYNEIDGATPVKIITFKNFWCTDVSDTALDNSSAAFVDVSANFRYDYFEVERI
jgi:hypothetical protein